MNSVMEGYYPILEQYQALRDQPMEIITNEELSYTPGGENPTLGALCLEMGEVQAAYNESFKTLKLDFACRNESPGLEGSVEGLSRWSAELDRELRDTIAALSEDDVRN